MFSFMVVPLGLAFFADGCWAANCVLGGCLGNPWRNAQVVTDVTIELASQKVTG
jgi:hypothetical protein